MKLIRYNEEMSWNKIVKSFKDWDVYYLNEYTKSFMIHGDGEPLLFYYADKNVRVCLVTMLNDLHKLNFFKDYLDKEEIFDISTPYGYGGPLIDGIINDNSINCFKDELFKLCNELNIVSQFVRFHPLLRNNGYFEQIIRPYKVKKTIYMDLSNKEKIFENIHSKNRNLIRKAIRNGVRIKITEGKFHNIDEFMSIYNETMNRNNARDYYYFEKGYYKYLENHLDKHFITCRSVFEGKTIGVAIFLYNEKSMHYHLSGIRNDYRKLASSNLLLYIASLWGSKKNIKKMHLGGGVGNEDGLFHFKKQFNKYGEIDFYIGNTIFNEEKYKKLLEIRKEFNPDFDEQNDLLIKYRKE